MKFSLYTPPPFIIRVQYAQAIKKTHMTITKSVMDNVAFMQARAFYMYIR